jgi:hypothetical protein
MKLKLALREARLRWAQSVPSMVIDPLCGWMMRSRVRKREDFPLPVLPTTPIFSPGATLKLSSRSTSPNYLL